MLASTWHLLVAAALLTSYVAIARRVDERLGGAVGMGLWGLAAIGAFDHEVVLDDGTRVAVEEPALGLFFAACALIMLAFTFAAVTDQLPAVRDTRFANRYQ